MPTQYNKKYVKPASLASLRTNLECGSGCISLSELDRVWKSSNRAWAEFDRRPVFLSPTQTRHLKSNK